AAVFLILTLFIADTAVGQDDRIASELKDAISKNPSTLGMVHAYLDAEKKWLEEIDHAISGLKGKLASEQWLALEESQKIWMAYRESELNAQGKIFGRMRGTMWQLTAASSRMELARSRASTTQLCPNVTGTMNDRLA